VLRGAAQKLDADGVINSPAQALNVFDFEPAAKKALAASPRTSATSRAASMTTARCARTARRSPTTRSACAA